jgi:hypothetical protein
MELTVTPEHAATGVRYSAATCPVALALRDVFGTVAGSAYTFGHVWRKGSHMRISYPRELSAAIQHFDTDGRFTPGTFTVTVNPVDSCGLC